VKSLDLGKVFAIRKRVGERDELQFDPDASFQDGQAADLL
jgi:hypothetical protein